MVISEDALVAQLISASGRKGKEKRRPQTARRRSLYSEFTS
jgi:hypothetical protein